MDLQALVISVCLVFGFACRFLQKHVRWNYDVFLSFRGLDTRNGFTNHLYMGLVAVGLAVFQDDLELFGEKIDEGIFRAIEKSKIAIVILSKQHAGSIWCLEELAMIMSRYAEKGLLVFPIFYELNVLDVLHQTGEFGRAFHELVRDRDPEEVRKWKEALVSVAKIKGWASQEVANGRQGELVKMVIAKVLSVLRTPWFQRLMFWRKGRESKCQVFLSSGPAAKKGLASHLYYRLKREGISVFNDDDQSLIGKDLAQEISKAIDQCKIYLVIISEDFVSSRSCLDNLTRVVKCMQENGQKVVPIFHKVEPWEESKLLYFFQNDMRRHEIPQGENTYDQWWESLNEVARIAGVVSENFNNGNEGKLVEHVLQKIAALLKNPNAWSTPAGYRHYTCWVLTLLGIKVVGPGGGWAW